MKEVVSVLNILRSAKNFVELDNAHELKTLSDQIIHLAAISQDADDVVVAVLIYSIGKVLERDHYRKMDGWMEFHETLMRNLKLAIKSLEKNDIDNMRIYLGRIRNSLNKVSGDLGYYIKDVFKKAEINKAFKLYEHGLSTEKTASLLGVSLWDMAGYIGQSHIGDAKIAITIPVRNRVKIAEEIFE